VHQHARDISQELFIKSLNMLMMRNMFLQYRHLPTANTGANITHPVVKANGRMLIIRIWTLRPLVRR
jgi:hypothetical protein